MDVDRTGPFASDDEKGSRTRHATPEDAKGENLRARVHELLRLPRATANQMAMRAVWHPHPAVVLRV